MIILFFHFLQISDFFFFPNSRSSGMFHVEQTKISSDWDPLTIGSSDCIPPHHVLENGMLWFS